MKILLIQPPIQDFYNTDIRLQPIGLAYLKSVIKKHFQEMDILIKDYHHGWGRKTVQLPKELADLEPFYLHQDKSPFALFNRYYHFGASFETIAREVVHYAPDLVGISSQFTPYYREVLDTASAIKKVWSGSILVGGSHASADPLSLLNHPDVDFVILGQGERPIVEFIKQWRSEKAFSKVPNLGYKKNGQLKFNEKENNFPIDDLPFPDFYDFNPSKYRFQNRPLCFVITSRGCPYQCTFCSVHQTFGNQFRQRSVRSIVEEINLRYAQGYRSFDFEDDSLNYDAEWFETLLKTLTDKFNGKDVAFLAMNGLHYLHLNQKILFLMKQAGFKSLNISLVSLNKQTCRMIKRPLNIKKYLSVVQHAFTLGFDMVCYQILGLPGEELTSMKDTLIYNARLPVRLGASPFYVTPGMPILKQFEGTSPINRIRARLTALGIESDEYEKEDIYTLLFTARIINFLKSLDIIQKDIPFQKLFDLEDRFDARVTVGMKLLRDLFNNQRLDAATSKGFVPITKFKPDLFFNIWNGLDYIQTLTGRKILINQYES